MASEFEPSIEAQSSLDLEREMWQVDLAEARAEIARLEKELVECREELAGAVLTGREDRLRAAEAKRELSTREAVACDYGKLTAYREALERIAAMPEGNSTDGGLEPSLEAQIAQKALDTQAREGHGSAD